ncbi:MAG TPA: hypothetical protein VGH27_20890 [Streptosporangiaceae bacterium]
MFERVLSRLRGYVAPAGPGNGPGGRRLTRVRAALAGVFTPGRQAHPAVPPARDGSAAGWVPGGADGGGRHRRPVTTRDEAIQTAGHAAGPVQAGYSAGPGAGPGAHPTGPAPAAGAYAELQATVPGPRPAGPGGRAGDGGGAGSSGGAAGAAAGNTRAGNARARTRRKQGGTPAASPVRTQPGRAGQAGTRRAGQQRSRPPQESAGSGRGAARPGAPAAARPWYEVGGAWQERTDGGRHCGSLEPLVHRQWDPGQSVPAEVLHAVARLADLPQTIKDKLATAVDAIYIGPGGVPELDDMGRLSGVPLPSGRATWDACAGAYGDRKIVVGTRPSPSPDVMCHEVGHAIDDSDAPPGRWQSDSAEFRKLYDQCLPHLVSDFHKQQGALGRREFFADAFAAIASRQRPALVDMLGGSTRVALNVMLYFNRRYGL